MMKEEKFYGKIWKTGSGSLVITIPSNIVKGAEYEEGTTLEIKTKKINEE